MVAENIMNEAIVSGRFVDVMDVSQRFPVCDEGQNIPVCWRTHCSCPSIVLLLRRSGRMNNYFTPAHLTQQAQFLATQRPTNRGVHVGTSIGGRNPVLEARVLSSVEIQIFSIGSRCLLNPPNTPPITGDHQQWRRPIDSPCLQ